MSSSEHDPELEQLAKEHYNKSYDQLDTHEKRSVAGYKGQKHRAEHGHSAGGGAETQSGGHPHEADPELEQIAKEKFGKSYKELDTHDKRACAGIKGTKHRMQHTGKGE